MEETVYTSHERSELRSESRTLPSFLIDRGYNPQNTRISKNKLWIEMILFTISNRSFINIAMAQSLIIGTSFTFPVIIRQGIASNII